MEREGTECFCDEGYDCLYCLGLIGAECAPELIEDDCT